MNRLVLLEKRRERSNEMDLLDHFMEELTAFEGKLVSALTECRRVVSEVQDLMVGGGEGSEGSSGTSSSSDSSSNGSSSGDGDVVPSMLEKLLEQLSFLSSSTRGQGLGGSGLGSAQGLGPGQGKAQAQGQRGGNGRASSGSSIGGSIAASGGGANGLDVAQSWPTLLLAIKGAHTPSHAYPFIYPHIYPLIYHLAYPPHTLINPLLYSLIIERHTLSYYHLMYFLYTL